MGLLKSILHAVHASARNTYNKVTRPPAVTRAQHQAVKDSPICAACGCKDGLQGHHVRPYHKFPELAADPKNFIVLCEVVGGYECHLHIGHGGSFKCYNPDVIMDAQRFKMNNNEGYRKALLAEIKAKRQIDG